MSEAEIKKLFEDIKEYYKIKILFTDDLLNYFDDKNIKIVDKKRLYIFNNNSTRDFCKYISENNKCVKQTSICDFKEISCVVCKFFKALYDNKLILIKEE